MKKGILSLTLVAAFAIGQTACNTADVAEALALAQGLAPIAGQLAGIADPSAKGTITTVENSVNAVIAGVQTFNSSPTASNLQDAQAAVAGLEAANASLQSTATLSGSTDTTVTTIVGLIAAAVGSIGAVLAAQAPKPTTSLILPRGMALGFAAETKPAKVHPAITSKDLKKKFNALAKKDKRLKPVK